MILCDCGFYAGIATKKYIDQVEKVYAFEPRPITKEIPEKVKLIKKAVWTENGKAKFYTKGRDDASHLAEDGDMTVGTIDFSEFVRNLPEDDIICSMDIEGAEYPVLRKMIDEGTIDKIKLLDIEFHHRFLSDYVPEDSQKLIDELEQRGIKVILKVEL